MDTNKVNEAVEQMIEVISVWGLNVLGAIAILVLGFIAAGWAARATDSALRKSGRIDETLRHFLTTVVRYAVIVFAVVATLEQFGVETTSFVAVLGAAGLAIGLAFQGTLGNIAAGVMLLVFRPFRVGQFIEAAGASGTVKMISLFTTDLDTPDNVRIIIPNGQLWGSAVKNYSFNDKRRLDIVVGIDYADDIGKAFDIINGVIAGDTRIHDDPAPALMVANLGDSSVDLQLRLWCAASDYWPIKFELNRRIKEALDAGGITIPFPQRTIHMVADN